MSSSDWSSVSQSQNKTVDEVNSFSKDIANRLEYQGGKQTKPKAAPKPRGFQAKTKQELLELAKQRKIKVSSNFTKEKIIEALRKK